MSNTTSTVPAAITTRHTPDSEPRWIAAFNCTIPDHSDCVPRAYVCATQQLAIDALAGVLYNHNPDAEQPWNRPMTTPEAVADFCAHAPRHITVTIAPVAGLDMFPLADGTCEVSIRTPWALLITPDQVRAQFGDDPQPDYRLRAMGHLTDEQIYNALRRNMPPNAARNLIAAAIHTLAENIDKLAFAGLDPVSLASYMATRPDLYTTQQRDAVAAMDAATITSAAARHVDPDANRTLFEKIAADLIDA